MSEDMLNVMGSFISTELDAFENLHKELEEKDKEIERLNNIIIKNKYSTDELNEIERLRSIIKEVREYIKDACYLDEINYPNSLGHKQTMKVLEILDKENI